VRWLILVPILDGVLSRVGGCCVTYKTGSVGLDDWIYWHFIHTTRGYRQYSAIADVRTVHRYTRTRILSLHWSYPCNGFISVTVTSNHTWSILYTANFFLSFHYSATAKSEDSTEFNSSAPRLLPWQAGVSELYSTQFYAATASFGNLSYIHFARTTQKTQPLYCWQGLFTRLLHSNGRYSFVACVFVAAEMCLPSRF
jgi:hypothetical protein